jgi:hypothetical protein
MDLNSGNHFIPIGTTLLKLKMNSVQEYPRKWVKKERVELDTLSEYVRSNRYLMLRIRKLDF